MSSKQFTFSSSSTESSKFTFSSSSSSTSTSETDISYNDSSGTAVVTLGDEALADVREVAQARAASYKDGRTRDEATGKQDAQGAHDVGVMAEKAVAIAFGGSIDRSVSAKGDDGIDIEDVPLDEKTYDVDVKSTTYNPRGNGGSWMMQKAYKSVVADAFIVCYVDESTNTVHIKGWATRDELVQESNIEDSPGRGDWNNYTLREDEYRNCPPL